MAKATVANRKRYPSDPLEPMDQEQVYNLIRQALGIALLVEADGDEPPSQAAGAMVVALHKARRIMELGSEEAVDKQEAQRHG